MKTTNAMKRLFSFLLALMLVLSIIPQLSVPVSAFTLEIYDADSTIDGAFEYLDPVILGIRFGNANHNLLTATVSYPYTGKTWTVSDASNSLAYIDLSDAFTAETFPSVDSPVEQRTFHVKANYKGETLEKDYVFAVKPNTEFNDSRNFTVSPEEWTYSGGIPEVTLVNTGTKYGDKVLVEGVDFTLENQYGNNYTGWNEYLFTGIGNYSGSFVELIRINPTTEIPDIRMEADAVHYDGTAKTPGVIITFNGKTVDTTDYELSYSDNTEVGTATVTITGRRNFSYETTRTFQVQDHVWVNECCGTDLHCKDCDATKENDRTEHEFSNSACLHCSFVCQNHDYNTNLECTICGAKMENYVGVNDITLDIGTTVPANREVLVTATAYPEDRTGQDVVFTYEIEEDNGAQAYVGGGNLQSTYLTAYDGGTFKLKVTANDGFTTYSKTFTITSVYTPVTAVDGTVPTEAEVGQITLPSGFLPQEVSSKYDLAWEVQSGPATVQGNVLTLTGVGTVKLRAYVINGLGVGQPFIQEYTIEAKPAQTVLPVELKINEGNIIISEHSATELKVEYGGINESVISKDTPVQISGSSNSNYTITVKSGAPKIILRDVNIRNYSAHPLLIESGASADITLLGSNTLDASVRSVGVAGLGVPEGAAVTIGGTGTLTVKGGGDAAGIGSSAERNSGTITMNGGTVNATGGDYGAGIGSGDKGTAGTITINGGNVNAQGGDSAAGIGGGNGGVASVVAITGGSVDTTGGRYGPGIGSGKDRDYTNSNPAQITITGGTVTARGGSEGAGIGGGNHRPGAAVTITGGNVTAIGNYNGAGIGGGSSSPGGNVTISGGVVTATGGHEGAGIGSGAYSGSNNSATGGSVTISGGTVTAVGGQFGAGIGGGRNCPGGNVVITGGNVKTSPGTYAKAIGNGYDGRGAGTLTNGTDPVTLNTITLVGMTEQSAVTAVAGIGSYGLQDVRTLDTNKLYFYLPADTTATSITAGDGTYYFCKDNSLNYYTNHDWSNKDGVCSHCGETCDHEGEENICSICGKPLHVHDWEYTAAGNTITAKCRNADTCSLPEQSITIFAAGKTYDGTAVTATLTGSIEGVESPAISYSGNTDAGLHTASIQLDGKKATVSFEIEAAIPTVVWDNTSASMDYTGSAAVITAPVVTLVNNETYSGTIHYSYTGTSSGNGLPTHAGSYTVTASVAANGNYAAATSTNTLQLTIHKIDSMYTIPTGLTAIYGDTLADVQLPEGFAWEDASTTFVGNVGNNNFDVTYTPKDTVNYNTVTGISVGIEVGKAASSMIRIPTANELTYNGSEQTLIVTGSTNDGRLVYSLTEDGAYSEVLPKATDAGTYHVWYKVIGDENHTDSDPASVAVKIAKADPGIGAVTAAVVNNTLETSAIVLTQANTTVQGALTVDAGQTLALGRNTIRYTFTPTDGANYLVVTGEVNVTVADTIAPTGTVTISTESWTEFLNNITFGLFFKETQTVSVAAEDNLSGVAAIEYIESRTAMDLAAVQAATQWMEMKNGSVSVTLEDAKQFVYYIRITDKSGNVSYLCSDGAEYDTTAPVIKGVDNGVTYYTTQAVTVTDKNMDTITLNGKTATDFITLEGNKEATYTIVATDKAGNSTTVTVKMAPIADIAEFMDDKSNANVTSDDKSNLQTILDTATELLKDGDMTAGEKAELEKIKSHAEELIQIIENTAAEQKSVADQAAEFDEDTVKSIHKAELEKLADKIDALLDTDNLTRDERAALETLLEQVEDMIHTINKVAADSKIAKDTVDAYDPATVKSTDKASIETALDTIKNLLGTKHLTVAEREALEKAKADAEALLEAIEEAAKAADTDNTAKVEDVTADNVTPEDKSDLEKARDDLKDALENYSDNYTEEEKKAIEDEIQRIEDAIEVIENVENVEDAVSDLPSTVEPDEEETVAKIEEAKKAYDQLTDYEKSLVDEKVKEKLDTLTAAAVDYEIVKGDAGTWSKGSTSSLPFTTNGSFSKFVCVEIDGNVIDAQHYTAEAGGTVITLNAAYLETLSTGEHTITIVYTDGEAEGSFVIDAESAVSATGNGSNIMLYGIVFAIGLAVLLVLILVFKKRKQTD